MHQRSCILASIALACLAIAPAPAPSLGCVADVFTLDRLATESTYVVTATVSGVRSYWTPDHMTIETEVTLTGVDRITRDGARPEPDINYTVVGGTVGDCTLRVCCAPDFKVGDQWVLFLLREFRQYPVLGMERGMFRIAQVEGAPARILTSGGDPIVAINGDGAITAATPAHAQSEGPAQTRQPKSVSGSISAVRVVDREEAAIADRAAPIPGLTLEAFLAQVRMRMPEDVARDGGAGIDIELARVKPAMAPAALRSAKPLDKNPEGAK